MHRETSFACSPKSVHSWFEVLAPPFFFLRPLCSSLAVDTEYAEQTAHCTVSGVGDKLHAGKG